MHARMVILAFVVATLLALLFLTWIDLLAPRTDRDWASDHAVPARVHFAGDSVRVENLRDFRHDPEGGSWNGIGT